MDDYKSFSLDNIFIEKSHGDLKSSFRLGINPDNGHIIKVVFDLDPNDVDIMGKLGAGNMKNKDNAANDINRIKKTGSNDFSSVGIIKAIVDMDTNQNFQSMRVGGIISGRRIIISDKYRDDSMGGNADTFGSYPVKVREKIIKEQPGIADNVQLFTVGMKEKVPSYKATKLATSCNALYMNQFLKNKDVRGNSKHNSDRSLNINKSLNQKILEFNKLKEQIELLNWKSNNDQVNKWMVRVTSRFNELVSNLNRMIDKYKDDRFNQSADSHQYNMTIQYLSDTIESMKEAVATLKYKNKDIVKTESANGEYKFPKPTRNNLSKEEASNCKHKWAYGGGSMWCVHCGWFQQPDGKITKTVSGKGGEFLESVFIDVSDYFEEKSNGLLNFSFRMGINKENGHLVKIVFDLKPKDIKRIGSHDDTNPVKNKSERDNIKKNIRKTGYTDFTSYGKVLGITDMDTKERLTSVKATGIQGGNQAYARLPLAKREELLKNGGFSGFGASTFIVGEREDDEESATYKSTKPAAKVDDLVKFQNNPMKMGRGNNMKESVNTPEYNTDMTEVQAKKTMRTLSQSLMNDIDVSSYFTNRNIPYVQESGIGTGLAIVGAGIVLFPIILCGIAVTLAKIMDNKDTKAVEKTISNILGNPKRVELKKYLTAANSKFDSYLKDHKSAIIDGLYKPDATKSKIDKSHATFGSISGKKRMDREDYFSEKNLAFVNTNVIRAVIKSSDREKYLSKLNKLSEDIKISLSVVDWSCDDNWRYFINAGLINEGPKEIGSDAELEDSWKEFSKKVDDLDYCIIDIVMLMPAKKFLIENFGNGSENSELKTESADSPEYNTDMTEVQAKKTMRTLSQTLMNDINGGKKMTQYTANIYANIITKNLLPKWANGFSRVKITLDSYQSLDTFQFITPAMSQDFIGRFVNGRESMHGFLHRSPEIRIKVSPKVFHTMKNPDDAYNFFKAAIKYYDTQVEKYAVKVVAEAMKLGHNMKHLIANSKLSGIVSYPLTMLFVFDGVDISNKDIFKINTGDIQAINKFIRNISSRYAAPEKEKKQIVDDVKKMVEALRESCGINDTTKELHYLPEAVDNLLFGGYDKLIIESSRLFIESRIDHKWNPPASIKYMKESWGVKKLKKIPKDLIPYIQIETEAIKDANDKMILSSYTLGKIEIVEWYIELLTVGSKKYIVPHTKPYLELVRTQLLQCFKKIMDTPVNKKDKTIDIKYPPGYEG